MASSRYLYGHRATIQNDSLRNTQLSQHLDGGVREAWPCIASFKIGPVAGLSMTWQIEGDQAVFIREPPLHLMAKRRRRSRMSFHA